MKGAWGPGPVFVYESILEARRWQVYATRSAFVLMLLAGLGFAWLAQGGRRGSLTLQDLAEISEGFFYALAGVQVSLVLLAAPAVAAGSICGDRSRGTLAHLMVTDLSDREIVLGKLGARLAPVIAIVLAAAPVAALGGLMGGLDFPALASLFAETAAMAAFGVSLAMAASVRAERPREALMTVYAVEVAWLIALPLWWMVTGIAGAVTGKIPPGPPVWFRVANPFVIAFAPYSDPHLVPPGGVVAFCGALLALAALLLGLTMRGLRRAVPGSVARTPRRRSLGAILFPSVTGPGLDADPVLWREWHRNRPSRWERRLWGGLALICWGLVGLGMAATVVVGLDHMTRELFTIGLMLQVAFGFLMLSVAAPSALAEERVRGSLDVLLATPLASRSILAAKWWGLYRRVLALAVLPSCAVGFVAATAPDLPALPPGARMPALIPLTLADRAIAVILTAGDVLASGVAIVSLGLALATWVPRLGRAIALGVTAYFFFGIAWLFLVELLPMSILDYSRLGWDHWSRHLFRWLMSISPIAGPITPLELVAGFQGRPRGQEWTALGAIVALKAAVAWGLFALTARTFDRCLGRLPESPRPARRGGRPGRVPERATPGVS